MKNKPISFADAATTYAKQSELSPYWERYNERVEALEAEGLTRSDAQGVIDAEDRHIPNVDKFKMSA